MNNYTKTNDSTKMIHHNSLLFFSDVISNYSVGKNMFEILALLIYHFHYRMNLMLCIITSEKKKEEK